MRALQPQREDLVHFLNKQIFCYRFYTDFSNQASILTLFSAPIYISNFTFLEKIYLAYSDVTKSVSQQV